MNLVLVTRQGCHLCDDALATLRRLGLKPTLLDVDTDDHLHELYDWRVPVILLEGQIIAEGKVRPETVERALRGVS